MSHEELCKALRQGSLSKDDYRYEAADRIEALTAKLAEAEKVGYSQAKRDLCLFLDPDLASADAWGWDDDSVFAAALARLTTPKPDQIDTVARTTLAEIEGEK
jgi:hypothetical protein